MGIFDRFRPADPPAGRTYEGQRVPPSDDEQALARYRYMLKTAPPETIEQAHVEAFARLTPQQRQMLLEQLRDEVPGVDAAYATEKPEALARFATRAEVRQPGTMERLFSRVPAAGPGLGGMMAGSLLSGMAGAVLGTMIAQNFLGSHALGDAAVGPEHGLGEGAGAEHAQDADPSQHAGLDGSDVDGGFDDIGGGFDGGSFDV
jgi:hypothetical protein